MELTVVDVAHNRPLSDRDVLLCQDFALMKSEGKPWFYTMNHDIKHVSSDRLSRRH